MLDSHEPGHIPTSWQRRSCVPVYDCGQGTCGARTESVNVCSSINRVEGRRANLIERLRSLEWLPPSCIDEYIELAAFDGMGRVTFHVQ